jgi:hypothetical protein
MPVTPNSYPTVAQFRAYLKQTTTTTLTDDDAQEILNRATAICDDASVGLGFHFGGYTGGQQTVLSNHSPYLELPPYQPGSVSAITLDGNPIVDWVADPDGTLRRTVASQWPVKDIDAWGWRGFYYVVTANWGYGPPPDSVIEVCLEVAVNIWRSRDAGRFTNVVGPADGGAVGYEGALTPLQRSVLQGLKQIKSRGIVAI